MMGITQVGSGETEGFDEGTDLVYHDAAEDPNVLDSVDNKREAVLSHGGCGSSSLRECIELLNNPQRNSPAPCHSGATLENKSSPSHWHLSLGVSQHVVPLLGVLRHFARARAIFWQKTLVWAWPVPLRVFRTRTNVRRF